MRWRCFRGSRTVLEQGIVYRVYKWGGKRIWSDSCICPWIKAVCSPKGLDMYRCKFHGWVAPIEPDEKLWVIAIWLSLVFSLLSNDVCSTIWLALVNNWCDFISLRTDLVGQVTDGKTQFFSVESFHQLYASGGNLSDWGVKRKSVARVSNA